MHFFKRAFGVAGRLLPVAPFAGIETRGRRLIGAGRFAAGRRLLRRRLLGSPEAEPALWQEFMMSALTPLSAYADADAALAHDAEAFLVGRRVAVVCDTNADLDLARRQLRAAAAARVLLEDDPDGLAGGRGGIAVERARDAFTLYDVAANAAAAAVSRAHAERLMAVLSRLFGADPRLSRLSGHEHALAQAVEPYVMELCVLSEGLDRLIDAGEIDAVAFVLADGTLARPLARRFVERLGPDRVFLARSKRRAGGDVSFIRWVERLLADAGLRLDPRLAVPQPPPSAGPPPRSTVFGRPTTRRAARLRRLALEASLAFAQMRIALPAQFTPSCGGAATDGPGVLFPTFAGESVVARGDRAALTALFAGEHAAFLVEDLRKPEPIAETRRFIAGLQESGGLASARLWARESTPASRRSQAAFREGVSPAMDFAAQLWIRSLPETGPLRAPRELLAPAFRRKLVAGLAACAEKIAVAEAFVAAVRPRFVALYPPALPSSRALAVAASRIGAPVVDIQPFFIMDEPRTRFHWARAGDAALIQSEAFRDLYRRLGYAPESILVTGTPRLDHLLDRAPRPGRTSPRRRILFAGQMLGRSIQREVFATLAAVATARDDVELVFKPHYMAAGPEIAAITAGAPGSAAVRVAPKADIYDLIDSADLVVTFFSNVALEAAIRGVDVICVAPPSGRWPEPMNLGDWGVAVASPAGPELRDAALALLFDPAARAALAARREAYFAADAHGARLPAAPRVAAAVRGVVAARRRAATTSTAEAG